MKLPLLKGDIDTEIVRKALDAGIWKRRPHSLLYRYDNYLLTIFQMQKYADFFRRYFASQARREADSSTRLSALWLKSPEIYGYAVVLNPFCRYDSILLMELVEYENILSLLLRRAPKDERRERLLRIFAQNLNIFFENEVAHKDPHYGNILVTADDELVWIDNDIAPMKRCEDELRFMRKYLKKDFLSEDEARRLVDSLRCSCERERLMEIFSKSKG